MSRRGELEEVESGGQEERRVRDEGDIPVLRTLLGSSKSAGFMLPGHRQHRIHR
jgi:hypothetical protein